MQLGTKEPITFRPVSFTIETQRELDALYKIADAVEDIGVCSGVERIAEALVISQKQAREVYQFSGELRSALDIIFDARLKEEEEED